MRHAFDLDSISVDSVTILAPRACRDEEDEEDEEDEPRFEDGPRFS